MAIWWIHAQDLYSKYFLTLEANAQQSHTHRQVPHLSITKDSSMLFTPNKNTIKGEESEKIIFLSLLLHIILWSPPISLSSPSYSWSAPLAITKKLKKITKRRRGKNTNNSDQPIVADSKQRYLIDASSFALHSSLLYMMHDWFYKFSSQRNNGNSTCL